jgi:uncharacterized membrane protein YcaP (DUF421 family)
MLNIVLRVLIIYTVAFVVIRLMGKRQIGEMAPFELVITLIIADLATIPMSDPTIPIWYGVLPLLFIEVLHFFVTKLQYKSKKFRSLISGNPVIVITPNGVDRAKLKSLDICDDELTEMLRAAGTFDIKTVKYAIIETNGKLSIIPKEEE